MLLHNSPNCLSTVSRYAGRRTFLFLVSNSGGDCHLISLSNMRTFVPGSDTQTQTHCACVCSPFRNLHLSFSLIVCRGFTVWCSSSVVVVVGKQWTSSTSEGSRVPQSASLQLAFGQAVPIKAVASAVLCVAEVKKSSAYCNITK